MGEYRTALKCCDKKELVLMIAAISARLGAPEELPEDANRVLAIGHQLKAIHAGRWLSEGMRKIDFKYRLA